MSLPVQQPSHYPKSVQERCEMKQSQSHMKLDTTLCFYVYCHVDFIS